MTNNTDWFANKYGCESTDNRFDLKGLAKGNFSKGERIDDIFEVDFCGFPGDIGDHTMFYVKNDKSYAITTELYSVNAGNIAALIKDCERLGLSIYLTGSTTREGCIFVSIFAPSIPIES
jgi:hypothetical protein